MEELRSLLNSPKVTGFGLLFGFSQLIKPTAHGLLLAKLISWSLVVTQLVALLAVKTPLLQLFTGAPPGIRTNIL
jgi:hypothetical protein